MKTKVEEAAVVKEDLINNFIVKVAVVEEVNIPFISHFNQISNFRKKYFKVPDEGFQTKYWLVIQVALSFRFDAAQSSSKIVDYALSRRILDASIAAKKNSNAQFCRILSFKG